MDIEPRTIIKNTLNLNQCFLTLGAPMDYCYRGHQFNIERPPRKETHKLINIYTNDDGTLKPKDLLLKDLKKYWRQSCKKYHPDKKPSQGYEHYNKQMKAINEIYDRGQKIIKNHYKRLEPKRIPKYMIIAEAFSYND